DSGPEGAAEPREPVKAGAPPPAAGPDGADLASAQTPAPATAAVSDGSGVPAEAQQTGAAAEEIGRDGLPPAATGDEEQAASARGLDAPPAEPAVAPQPAAAVSAD